MQNTLSAAAGLPSAVEHSAEGLHIQWSSHVVEQPQSGIPSLLVDTVRCIILRSLRQIGC